MKFHSLLLAMVSTDASPPNGSVWNEEVIVYFMRTGQVGPNEFGRGIRPYLIEGGTTMGPRPWPETQTLPSPPSTTPPSYAVDGGIFVLILRKLEFGCFLTVSDASDWFLQDGPDHRRMSPHASAWERRMPGPGEVGRASQQGGAATPCTRRPHENSGF